jgi:hypothetical protein
MSYDQTESDTNVPTTLFCHYGGGKEEDFLKMPTPRSKGKKLFAD